MFDFSEQVVLVTGAAGNLGSAVALAFQGAGAKLVLVDHAKDRLPDTFPELSHSSDHFMATGVDLTRASDVETMVEATMERMGRIDILANIAGGFRAGTPVHETSFETWDFMLDLNARSVLILARTVVPHMLAQESGKIINVAARAALKGRPKMAAYSAAKSAVIRLTESMSAELGKANINVNCILPSTIDTPENREAMPNADFSQWVQPEAIADVVQFLASEAARAIKGAAIPV
jgi:NAD(P)-dependent dehydrogenase (short-subunit alcohol dehydrogenase family)